MTNYEIMFIVKSDLEEAAIKKEAENLKKVLTILIFLPKTFFYN